MCQTARKDRNKNVSLMLRNQFPEEEEHGLGIEKVPSFPLAFQVRYTWLLSVGSPTVIWCLLISIICLLLLSSYKN